ncbi:hypothetical protein F4802DRAFT_562339 [Xylaria palmicola]|nr:hypothetical protein F4802DRAFT_562339 [Xylaria palmicola]
MLYTAPPLSSLRTTVLVACPYCAWYFYFPIIPKQLQHYGMLFPIKIGVFFFLATNASPFNGDR